MAMKVGPKDSFLAFQKLHPQDQAYLVGVAKGYTTKNIEREGKVRGVDNSLPSRPILDEEVQGLLFDRFEDFKKELGGYHFRQLNPTDQSSMLELAKKHLVIVNPQNELRVNFTYPIAANEEIEKCLLGNYDLFRIVNTELNRVRFLSLDTTKRQWILEEAKKAYPAEEGLRIAREKEIHCNDAQIGALIPKKDDFELTEWFLQHPSLFQTLCKLHEYVFSAPLTGMRG